MFKIYNGKKIAETLQPYYHVDTQEKKEHLIKVAKKHGIIIDKPKSRVPFYVSMEQEWNNEGKSFNFLVEKKFDEDLLKYGYLVAPFENIEEDAIICFKPELLDGCTQFKQEVLSSGTFNRYTTKLYRANGDRWFNLRHDATMGFYTQFGVGSGYNYQRYYEDGKLDAVPHKKLDLIEFSET